MKTAVLILGVAVCGGLALFACSSDGEDRVIVINGPDAGGSPTSSSGAAPGSSSGDPVETVSCEVATATGQCTMPSDAFAATDIALTTDATCKTSLYEVGRIDPSGNDPSIIRKFTLKTMSPCVWERDPSIADVPGANVIAADDAGDILTLTADAKTVEILRGAKTIACTGALPADAGTYAAALARDGTVGYLGHYDYDQGNVVNASLSKVTLSADGCAVAPLPITGDPLSGVNGIALDTKGRLHVADATISGGAHRVAIYQPDGTFVASYNSDGAGDFFSPTSITACKGGICVDAFSAIVSYDENGVPRNHAEYKPTQSLSGLIRILGTPRGPFFHVGDSYGTTPQTLLVDALVQP